MDKTLILFLSASPKGEDDTSFIQAAREIEDKIAKYDKYVDMAQEHRISVSELQELLLTKYTPQIVHFYGHGAKGFLMLEDEQGNVQEANLKAFANMFKLLNGRAEIPEERKIRCVVLVACNSRRIAKAVSEYVDCSIGMTNEISDELGREFAKNFYFYLCSGNNVKFSYDYACNAIGFTDPGDKKTPILEPGPGCDPENLFFTPHKGHPLKPPKRRAIERPGEREANTHIKLGIHLHEIGSYKEAEEQYEEALKIDTNNAIAHVNYGNLLRDLKRYPEAEEQFWAALKIDPDNADAHIGYGRFLYYRDRYKKAEEHYKEALRIDPDNADAHYYYGKLLRVLDRFEEAEEQYEEALKMDPDNAIAHVNYGFLLRNWHEFGPGGVTYMRGRFEEAEDQFKAALKIDPDDPIAHIGYADVLYMLKRYPEAEVQYKAALKIDPNSALAHISYSDFLRALNRHPEAEVQYKAALKIDKSINRSRWLWQTLEGDN